MSPLAVFFRTLSRSSAILVAKPLFPKFCFSFSVRKGKKSVFQKMNEQIVILDFGSQYTQVIARRIRECKVFSTILRYDTPAAEIAKLYGLVAPNYAAQRSSFAKKIGLGRTAGKPRGRGRK